MHRWLGSAFAGLALAGAPGAGAVQLMTEELPPYSFQQGREVNGLSIDIIRELFRRSEVAYEIRMVPLRRALATVEQNPDACVFPLERSQEREARYTWVSPLLITRTGFYSRPDSDLAVHSLADARELAVGTYAGSAVHEYLQSFGYSGVQVAREELLNARKLQAKRIDLWATDSVSGRYFARRAGITGIQEQFVFLTTLRGIACNAGISPGITRTLQRELRGMHVEGVVRGIMDRYRYEK